MSISPQTPHPIQALPYELCQGCAYNGSYPWNDNPVLLCTFMGGMVIVPLTMSEEDVISECLMYMPASTMWSACLEDVKSTALHNEEMRMKSLRSTNLVYSSELLPAEYLYSKINLGVDTESGGFYYWREQVCHDCRAKPGELHELGCDMELCPYCETQLITCGEEHFKLVEAGGKSRIPFIRPITNCSVCGILWPDMFSVPDRDWDKYVPSYLQPTVICRPCYDGLKELFPEGWRRNVGK